MPELTITFSRDGGKTAGFKVVAPATAVEAGDIYAQRTGKANIEHAICRLLLDGLLVGAIIPQADVSAEYKATVDAVKAEADAKLAELEEARVAPFLPTLYVGGVQTTLPEIEASLQG